MNLEYSFIIPVYNRPEEIRELLQSMMLLNFDRSFEVVIVEDGSTLSSEKMVAEFEKKLYISYYFKKNSGPGDSRNFGMEKANGNYFLILDSDVILPSDYLKEVDRALKAAYTDCFGGRDAAHSQFSNLQKAIDYSMTSLLTTGGIRGGKTEVKGYQPRSFNMGLSKKAFQESGGFGSIHPGEDPDLALRLQDLGFSTRLIAGAVVFHKRRINWKLFYKQVHKFGMVRPILNRWHPSSKKITYWFPSVFILGFIISILLLILGWWIFSLFYLVYFLTIGLGATFSYKSAFIGVQSMAAVGVQFYGYGTGFLKSNWYINVLKKEPESAFPKLFFKNA